MTFLLDHLTAVVAGTVLIGALVAFQMRASADAVEAVEAYREGARAAELSTVLDRELENARSRSTTEAAYAVTAGGAATGAAAYRFSLRRARTADGTEYTSQAAFPTLADPASLSASPVEMVVYRVEPSGETARVDGRDRPLLRATRYEYPRGGPLRETGTFEGLVDFDVAAVGAGGVEMLVGEFASTPTRLRYELRQATADGGASTAHGRTLRALAAALPGAHPVDEAAPGGLPALPGDDLPRDASGDGTTDPTGGTTDCVGDGCTIR